MFCNTKLAAEGACRAPYSVLPKTTRELNHGADPSDGIEECVQGAVAALVGIKQQLSQVDQELQHLLQHADDLPADPQTLQAVCGHRILASCETVVAGSSSRWRMSQGTARYDVGLE